MFLYYTNLSVFHDLDQPKKASQKTRIILAKKYWCPISKVPVFVAVSAFVAVVFVTMLSLNLQVMGQGTVSWSPAEE